MSDVKSVIKTLCEEYNSVFLWERNLVTFNGKPDVWVPCTIEFELVLRGTDDEILEQHEKNQGTLWENVLTVIDGKPLRFVKGDCNNIAQSILKRSKQLDLLPLDKMSFQLVRSVGGQTSNPMKYVDHAIAQFEIDGEFYNGDNASIYPFHKASQDPHYMYVEYMRMDKPGQMFKHEA